MNSRRRLCIFFTRSSFRQSFLIVVKFGRNIYGSPFGSFNNCAVLILVMQEAIVLEIRNKENDFPATDEEICASLDRALDDIKNGRFKRVR